MRKVVVDTHVLLASLLGGEARLVMKYWWEGKVSLCLSEEIAAEYLAALAQEGVLALPAGATVMRFLPPLVISEEDIETVIAKVAHVLGTG